MFEGRFRYLDELKKMGARIEIKKNSPAAGACGTVYIRGPSALKGANVEAKDLRGGAALILAGLAAEGSSFVSKAPFLDRGYEGLDLKLRGLGADIERLPPRMPPPLSAPRKPPARRQSRLLSPPHI